MEISEAEYLAHYGILRRSGRYPWGSSNNQSQRNKDFLAYIDDLKKRLGYTDTQVAEAIGISTTQLRASKAIAKSEQKQSAIIQAQALKDKGYSNVAIGERMGLNESSVRALLAPGASDKADLLVSTANMLKAEVADKKYIDVGTGVEHQIGISDTKLKTAVAMLQEEGYTVHYLKVQQLGTGKDTTVKVLAAPDTSYSEVYQNRGDLKQIRQFSDDGGRSFGSEEHPPLAIDPKRVSVKYAEDGGSQADGVIYVRPGVEDISLGNASYAQVRVKVGDGHYLKGMAMYKDDLPDGVDLVFNTNKSDSGNPLDAMKPLSDDPDLPFGAITRPLLKDAGTPNEAPYSVMNVVNEEGKWSEWSRTLSPQVLSKQDPKLARQQLALTTERRQKEFDEINSLTNPTVKRKLLEEFAEGTDAAAVHLKAAAMPRQNSHVILPVNSLSDREIYAPNYQNGERVALVRYPHAGTFEIPELVVNNSHPEAKSLLGSARDAVGIHHSVAERLSGADFDGDTVLVIPNNQGRIKSTKPLPQLDGFDPRSAYPGYPGMKKMTNTQTEMGIVSNLITDMTIAGAPTSHIARAVKHSMVVIDAEKHGLNYKESYKNNGIKALKEEYQTKPDGSGGASTLISRAKGRVYIDERKPRTMANGGPVDPKTGKLMYEPTGNVNYKTGKPIRTREKALAVTDDARTLSSGTAIEDIYAGHSNGLKAMANEARRIAVNTPPLKYSPAAKATYKEEVKVLDSKLKVALRNAPLERQAQVLANAEVKMKRQANPNMDSDTLKKVKSQALEKARTRTGAKKQRIVVTPAEWDAIQAGAISDSKLKKILANADMDVIREFATPRSNIKMTNIKTTRAKSMLSSGYTRAEVAEALGVSITTVDRAIDESE